jgi:hypothetical protein
MSELKPISVIDLYESLNELYNKNLKNMYEYSIIYAENTDDFQPNYELYTVKNISNIKKIELPPELTTNIEKIDYNDLLEKKYGNHLKDFVQALVDNFKEEDLKNVYHNLKSLVIMDDTTDEQIDKGSTVGGRYNSFTNELIIFNKFFLGTFYHELFHMSSRRKVNDKDYCGFNYKGYGIGLNEGYTDHMVEKYFGKLDGVALNYRHAKRISRTIENIIGRETMESLYLNSNLKGLINEMSKYMPKDKVESFILSTDFIFINKHLLYENNFYTELITENYKSINKFLIEMSIKKELMFSKDKEEIIGKVSNNLNGLTTGFNVKEKQYNFLPYEGSMIDCIEKQYELIQNKNEVSYER